MRRRKEGGKEKCGGAHKKPPSGLSRPPPPCCLSAGTCRDQRESHFLVAQECAGMCVKREVFGAWGGRRPSSFSSEGSPFSSQANLPSSSVPWQRGEETVNVAVRSTGCGQATLASQARMPLKNWGCMLCVQSRLLLCDPTNCSPPGPSLSVAWANYLISIMLTSVKWR